MLHWETLSVLDSEATQYLPLNLSLGENYISFVYFVTFLK